MLGARSTILFKLAGFVAVLIVLITGALGWGGYLFARGVLRERIDERLTTLISSRQTFVTDYIKREEDLLSALARRPKMRDLFQSYAVGRTDVATFRKQFSQVATDVESGNDVARVVAFADATGKVIAATDPSFMDRDLSANPDVTAGLRSACFGIPRLIEGRYYSMVTCPALGEENPEADNESSGVLIEQVDAHALTDRLILSSGLGQTGEIRIVARTADNILFIPAPRFSPGKAEFPSRDTPASVAAISGSKGVMLCREYTGAEVLAAGRPLPVSGWGLCAHIDLSEAYEPVTRVRNEVLLIELAIFAAALAGSYLLAREFVRPLGELASMAEQFAAGNRQARVAVTSEDELGRLGSSFNRMAEELMVSYSTLEERVEARTLQLARAERELDRFFTLSLDMLCILDLEGRIKRLNPAWERILGFSQDEMTTILPIDLLHPEDREKGLGELRRLAEGFEASVENRMRCKDGGYRWLSWQATPLPDEGVIYAAARDITERRNADEERRRLQNFLTSIVENIPDMIFVKDAHELRFVRFNKAGEDLLGYAREGLIGKNDYDFFPIDEADFFTAKDRGVLTSGKLLEISEEPIHTRFGTKILHTKKIPILDERGRPQYLLGISEDITERRRAQAALLQKTDELARSNAELEQFAYVASHDLQEPLRMITSYIQLLQRRYEGQLDGDADKFIGFAVDGAKRMKALIQDLLTYSKVGRLGKPFTNANLNNCLSDALANLKIAIEEKGARITRDVMPHMFADASQLTQLFQNLIGNAIKFGAQAESSVHIGATEEPGSWRFEVRDNGIGIDPQFFDRIFVIFQRLQPHGASEGTGIGLAICKKIVERHGGRIWVESEPGKGSVFKFTVSKELAQAS